jgi:hypothetical protein
MLRVTLKRSPNANGPFIRQLLSDSDTSDGCLRLLFMQILSSIMDWRHSLNASSPSSPPPDLLEHAARRRLVELLVELLGSALLGKPLLLSQHVLLHLLVVVH